ncbi:nicotinamide mononucleotide transporter [uncultured Gammaproteobacteria bacterium]
MRCGTGAMTGIEAAAAALGVVSVWLTIRQHLACWPTGIVMVALYAWVFFDARLYADAGLQVVFLGMQVYGWVHWRSGDAGGAGGVLPVVRLGRNQAVVWFAVLVLGTLALGTATAAAGAALPFVDAFQTVLSLIAQYLMARKVLDSWLMWIVVDVVSIGMYLSKDLMITAALYALFLGLAVAGLRAWRRSLAELAVPAAT